MAPCGENFPLIHGSTASRFQQPTRIQQLTRVLVDTFRSLTLFLKNVMEIGSGVYVVPGVIYT